MKQNFLGNFSSDPLHPLKVPMTAFDLISSILTVLGILIFLYIISIITNFSFYCTFTSKFYSGCWLPKEKAEM